MRSGRVLPFAGDMSEIPDEFQQAPVEGPDLDQAIVGGDPDRFAATDVEAIVDDEDVDPEAVVDETDVDPELLGRRDDGDPV